MEDIEELISCDALDIEDMEDLLTWEDLLDFLEDIKELFAYASVDTLEYIKELLPYASLDTIEDIKELLELDAIDTMEDIRDLLRYASLDTLEYIKELLPYASLDTLEYTEELLPCVSLDTMEDINEVLPCASLDTMDGIKKLLQLDALEAIENIKDLLKYASFDASEYMKELLTCDSLDNMENMEELLQSDVLDTVYNMEESPTWDSLKAMRNMEELIPWESFNVIGDFGMSQTEVYMKYFLLIYISFLSYMAVRCCRFGAAKWVGCLSLCCILLCMIYDIFIRQHQHVAYIGESVGIMLEYSSLGIDITRSNMQTLVYEILLLTGGIASQVQMCVQGLFQLLLLILEASFLAIFTMLTGSSTLVVSMLSLILRSIPTLIEEISCFSVYAVSVLGNLICNTGLAVASVLISSVHMSVLTCFLLITAVVLLTIFCQKQMQLMFTRRLGMRQNSNVLESESKRWIVYLRTCQTKLLRRSTEQKMCNRELENDLSNAMEKNAIVVRELKCLKRENDDLYNRIICTVCQENDRDIVLLPCKHLCVCHVCTDKINASKKSTDRKCPVCRIEIVDTVKFHNS